MAKLAQTSVKYLIKGEFRADGMVEKPDVIGALFGQTEGLLGPELDLRELQRTGRIGRIEVNVASQSGKANGEMTIPSSLDGAETALIAASLETIDRVGPCNAKIKILSIEDLRTVKRKYITDRAKNLLSSLLSQIPETSTVTEDLMQSIRSAEVTTYKGFPAGPDVATGDAIIICEGRADVITLLKNGIRNGIAIGGTSIPKEIGPICKEKEVTVFTDGDRGGDLIIKELKQLCDIDFVARAPPNKEVEELTKKELFMALRDKVPAEQAQFIRPIGEERSRESRDKDRNHDRQFKKRQDQKFERKPLPPKASPPALRKKVVDPEVKKFLKEQLNELMGTRAAAIFAKNNEFAGRVPIKELANSIKQVDTPTTIILDGEIDQELITSAESAGVQNIVGTSIKAGAKPRSAAALITEDL